MLIKQLVCHFSEKTKWFLFFLLLFLNLLFFNRFFPLSEGWHESYGYLINSGLTPFKDFSIESTILFSYFNSFLLKMTTSFFYLRLIGVFFFGLVYLLGTLLLENFFDKKSAAIGVFIGSLLAMNSVVFIAKDYHTFVDILSIISILSYLKGILSINHSQKFRPAIFFIASFAVGLLLCLLKQNIGLFLVTLNLCFLLVLGLRSFFLGGLSFLVSLGLVFFFLRVISLDIGEVFKMTFRNDSKGSPTQVLFRFFFEPQNRTYLFFSVKFVALAFFLYFLPQKKLLIDRIRMFLEPWTELLQYVLSGSFLVMAYFFSKRTNLLEQNILIPASLAVMVFSIFLYAKNGIKKNIHKIYFMFVLLTLAYCNTHTAVLNSTGMFLAISFVVSLFFSEARDLELVKIRDSLLFCFVIIFSYFIVSQKFEKPYGWWGLNQGSVYSAKYEIDHPWLKGIKVDLQTREIFEKVLIESRQTISDKKSVYFAPNIPIFYLLSGSLPPYKALVQWYDFISYNHGNEELEAFKANPPDLVVFLDPPELTDLGHFKMIGRTTFIQNFRRELNKKIDDHIYSLVYSKPMSLPGEIVEPSAKMAFHPECFGCNLDIKNILQDEKVFQSDLTQFGSILNSPVYQMRIYKKRI